MISKNRIAVALAVVFCSLAAVLGGGSGAHAATYPPAYNERAQFLAAGPGSGDPVAYKARPINLVAGCYDRELFIEGTDAGTESYARSFSGAMYLSAGAYNWQDALIPEPGYHYALNDIIYGVYPYTTPSTWEWSPLYLSVSGNYVWGTELRWLSPKCPPY